MHPFSPQKQLFRSYDIRGDYSYFTDDFVHSLCLSFVESYQLLATDKKVQIVLGYDMRQGSLEIAQRLASAFVHANIEVIWLGLVSTPLMIFWANQYQGHGIIATASHSAKNITGIKWLVSGNSAKPQDIQRLYNRTAYHPITIPTAEQVHDQWLECHSQLTTIQHPVVAYSQAIQQAMTKIDTIHRRADHQTQPINHGLSEGYLIDTLVIDCLNGATAGIAKTVFSMFANTVIVLNDVADGNFPKGNPDPTEAGRLFELQSAVIDYQAELGLAFDGDGDRIMVVDNRGQVVNADNLLYLLAQTAINDLVPTDAMNANLEHDSNYSLSSDDVSQLAKQTHSQTFDGSPEVIFDVKCSHHLSTMLEQIGITPVMSKTGSNHMREVMQNGNSQAVFAGELSGHFIFNDGHFISHDDGIYAGIRLLYWLAHQDDDLSKIIDELPTMVSTADIYIDVVEQQSIINKLLTALFKFFTRFKQQTNKARLTTIDGIRLDFEHGFGVVRASNTSQSLTVRFAGNTLADLKKIQQHFVELFQQIDNQLDYQLAKKIAGIQPVGA